MSSLGMLCESDCDCLFDWESLPVAKVGLCFRVEEVLGGCSA